MVTFELTVTLPGGRRLPVPITRKRVRNLNLRVRGDIVTMSIPLRATRARAQEFLDRHAAWIEARLERAAERERAVETADPRALPLWGRLADAAAVLDAHGPADLAPGDLAARIDALYRREVARALPDVAARAEQAVGAHAERWNLRKMTSRWGSCTPSSRAIRINTALAAYPPECLEMVVAHELVHLIEPSHDARFHALLDAACPRNREVAALLKLPPRAVARG